MLSGKYVRVDVAGRADWDIRTAIDRILSFAHGLFREKQRPSGVLPKIDFKITCCPSLTASQQNFVKVALRPTSDELVADVRPEPYGTAGGTSGDVRFRDRAAWFRRRGEILCWQKFSLKTRNGKKGDSSLL